MSFVNANIVTDPSLLLDDGLDAVNATLDANGLPGWEAGDATLAVIVMGAVAQMLAEAGNTATLVTQAIFRTFGTQFLGIPFGIGTAATVLSTWTFTTAAPTGGYFIPAGTTVLIDGYAFYAQIDTTTATGATQATITLVASSSGSAYNNLGGVNVGQPRVALNQFIDWVSTVTTHGVTSGGSDPETDDGYDTKLVGELALQAPRPIVASDYPPFVTSDLALAATGISVGRATAIDGYYPAARSLAAGGTGPAALTATATITSGQTTVTSVSTPYNGMIPAVGATVTGASGIPGGATVAASPAPTTTTFSLSAAATASTTETLTIGAWKNVPNAVTVFVADVSGNPLIAASEDALSAWLQTYRPTNWLVNVEPPSTSTIYVTALIKVLPGYDKTATAANAQAALIGWLSGASWGSGNPENPGQWLNSGDGFNIVRWKEAIAVATVPGVAYVDTLTLGFSVSPSGTTDLTMPGPAPLPTSSTSTILVTAE